MTAQQIKYIKPTFLLSMKYLGQGIISVFYMNISWWNCTTYQLETVKNMCYITVRKGKAEENGLAF